MPSRLRSQALTSPPNHQASMEELAQRQPPIPTARMGINSSASFPERRRRVIVGGQRYQASELTITRIGRTSAMPATAGNNRSRSGASQSPAKKPSTTVGKAATTSMIGLILARRSGCMNWEVQIAARIAIGTARNNAYIVPLRVPKDNGIRLSLGSKSSDPEE